jgi:apolipoprotein N-acyltransferase
VALVQGNVALDKKWSMDYRGVIVQRYARLTAEQHDVDVVVWPEAALPATRDELEDGFMQQLERLAAERKMELLIGMLEREVGATGRTYYNSVLAIGPHPGVYRKHHLVPFGEFLPLHSLMRWLPDYLYIPMSDFSPGPAQQPGLRIGGRTAGISICYEDAFGEQVRRSLPEAAFLVNVSEDAWYGDSWAPHQHQQMARMRSLENGRPMLRATNTGITAIIDHRGVELARAPQFAVSVLHGQIQPMRGVTPYARFGNTPTIVAALMALGIMLMRARRRDETETAE